MSALASSASELRAQRCAKSAAFKLVSNWFHDLSNLNNTPKIQKDLLGIIKPLFLVS